MAKAEAGLSDELEPLGFGGRLSDEALAELRAAYLSGVRQDLANLDGLLADLKQGRRSWPDSLFRLREVVHNIKGQGTSFGFPLMTEIGESLHRLLQQSPGDASEGTKVVIAAHVACLRRIIEAEVDGDGGPTARQLLDRLQALSQRATRS